MPMNPVNSAAILNALFHTEGSAGVTAEQEAAQLSAAGVNVNNEYSAGIYMAAFIADRYEPDGENVNRLNEGKKLVNATSWYYTVNTSSQKFDYKVTENGVEVTKYVTFSGWKAVKRKNQVTYYPKCAYLALYTTMPDKDGGGYVEPTQAADGTATTYMRINLHQAIISGGVAISRAAAGDENYTSVTVNSELMAYPEVSGNAWGTIVGFGVHDTDVPGNGAPVIWARLNESIPTTVGKVPLFRKDKFKLTFGPMGDTVGCEILDGLLGFKPGLQISFSGECWLGLLTRAPKDDRSAYDDGKFFSEPDDPEYVRVRVDDTSRINGLHTISGTESGEPVTVNDAGDLGQPNVVKNQALILMNEVTVASDIVAWGLFRNSDTTSSKLPFLVGSVKDSSGAATISLAPEEIPIVREGGLQISMM